MSDLDLLRRLGDQIVPPPIDELRATARRRTRRTTAVTAVATAAVAASVLAGVHLAVTDDNSTTQPTQPPEHEGARPLTYAVGATLHFGDQSIPMPGTVVEVDVVDDGAVARTDDGRVWFTNGGTPEQIGDIGSPAAAFEPELPPFSYNDDVGFVVSGNTGSLAGWFEFAEPTRPELVVFDTESGEETARQPVDIEAGSGAVLTTVNADYAYWDVDPQAFEQPASVGRIDLVTGEQSTEPQDAVARRGIGLEAAPQPLGSPRTVLVSHHEGGGGPYVSDEGLLQFTAMPGGRFEPAGMQPLEVLDGVTRTPFSFDVPAGYPTRDVFAFLVQWIDDDTVVMASYRSNADQELGSPDLLVCHISTDACEVVVRSVDAVLPELGRPVVS